MLTTQRVLELSNKPKVKKTAVENFLMSIKYNDLSRIDVTCNLEMDSKLYKWNVETQSAISQGIAEYFKK